MCPAGATDYSPAVVGCALAEADWAARRVGVEVNHRCNRQLSAANVAESDRVLNRLPKLGPPLVVLHGSDDPRPVSADGLVAAARQVTRTTVDGAGRVPWVEQPAEFRRLVLSLLD